MRAVVTGGARGIGLAIAERLGREGYEVVRLDVIEGDGIESCDVTDAEQVQKVASRIGPVDVLVNNAAIWRFAALEDVTVEDFERVLAVNLRGAFHCTQAFGRAMLDHLRGSIVNIVSIAAASANPAVGAYSASKAGLVALTRQTAIEWGPYGVRANAVGPGLVPTEGAGLYHDPDVVAARSAAVPLRRLAKPEEIAEVVAFLVSDAAAYVTGQVLYVDGGVSGALMTVLPRPAGTPGPGLREAAP